MSFRELFDKYLKGEASPEEIETVENEIEKNEILNDYVAERLDEDFLKNKGLLDNEEVLILNDSKEKGQDKMLEGVQKAVNRKFRRVAAASVLIVLAVLLALQYLVSPLINSLYYSPDKVKNQFMRQLDLDVLVYTELHFPGVGTNYASSESLGFGSYNVKINQHDRFKNTNSVYEGKIERGTMKYMQQDFYKFPYMNAFRYGVYPFQEFREDGDKKELEELRAMPESAYAKVYVSFKEDLKISRVVNLMKEHKDIYFAWVAVRSSPKDIQQLPQFGFEPTGSGIVVEKGTVDDEKYPYFELANEQRPYSEETLEKHFESLVKYMIDSEEFLKIVDTEAQAYKNALQYIEENGVKSYGSLVIGRCSEILKLRNNPAIESIRIDDIKLSSYSH